MIVAVRSRGSGKSVVAEYAAEEYERIRLAMIKALEQEPLIYDEETELEPEEEPGNKKIVVLTFPCNRQPCGHLIPWYTSGFQ